MGVITTWLNAIGLGHAAPMFKAAGIVTPEALADLDVTYFEALGVKDADDRRKLFYLVHRVKLSLDGKESKEEDVQNREEQLVALALESNRVVLASDDEDEEDQVLSSRSRRRNARATSDRPERSLKENVENSSPVKQPKSVALRRSSRRSSLPYGRRTSSGISERSTRSTRTSTRVSDNLVSKDTDDSGFDDDSRISNDASRRRRSQRLQNQGSKEASAAVPRRSTAPAEQPVRRQNQSLNATSSTASKGRTIPSKTTTRRQSTGTATRSSRRLSSEPLSSSGTGRRRALSSSDLELSEDDSSSSHSNTNTPSNTLPRPRTRRYDSNLPNPSATRIGKQLSTIPADSVAPMSPLVALPKSKMDAAIAPQQKKTTKAATKGRRKSTAGITRSHSSSSLGSSGRRQSASSGSDTESNRRKSTGRTSIGRASSTSKRRSLSSGRPGGLSKASSLRDVSSFDSVEKSSKRNRKLTSGSATGPVFVHGMPVDDSWATQVSSLREDNNAEHNLFQNGDSTDNSLDQMRIRVVVRKRPLSESEASKNSEIDVIHPFDYNTYGKVLVYQPKTRVDLTKEVESLPFAFDNVFDEGANNVQIYERTVRNLIPGVFEGQWASLFAYGQTGSGKTFTMMGCNLTGGNAGNSSKDESNLGLYYLAALDVFELANLPENRHLSVGVSLFEIYGGKLFDLLNDRAPVKCLEDYKGKVCFPGLSEHPVTNPRELLEVIEAGAENRSTGTTSKNADSSRSHAVMQLSLRKTVGKNANVEHGRLTVVDLAGSERGADTSQASRGTRREGADINTSLLALKEVIRALATGDSMAHIPFRGSKLTQVLKESFVGKNARSVMIACIAPNSGNCEHTLNTLRYANRVKERDAETGHAAVDAVCTTSKVEMPVALHRSLSAPPQQAQQVDSDFSSESALVSASPSSEKEEEGLDEDGTFTQTDDDLDEEDVRNDDDSDLLNRLLTSASTSPSTKSLDPASREKATKREVADPLIDQHKSVMTEMLDMIKTEMKMANEADKNRDNMGDYVQDLTALHERQLSLISTLRESLLEYYASRGPTSTQDVNNLDILSDDDSFEDLRD